MRTASTQNPFSAWAHCKVPSHFRHDLREAIVFNHEVGDHQARGDLQKQERLSRVIELLSQGHPIHVGDYPTGVYRRLLLLSSSGPARELRAGATGSIAIATRYSHGVEKSFLSLPSLQMVFFPAARHAGMYFEAGIHSRRNGPADTFPGSVGMLRLLWDPATNLAQLAELQSSVNFAHPEVNALLKSSNGNISSLYYRWRYHLLNETFHFVRSVGISQIAVGPVSDNRFSLNCRMRNCELVVEKALKSGFVLSLDRNILIDTLKM